MPPRARKSTATLGMPSFSPHGTSAGAAIRACALPVCHVHKAHLLPLARLRTGWRAARWHICAGVQVCGATWPACAGLLASVAALKQVSRCRTRREISGHRACQALSAAESYHLMLSAELSQATPRGASEPRLLGRFCPAQLQLQELCISACSIGIRRPSGQAAELDVAIAPILFRVMTSFSAVTRQTVPAVCVQLAVLVAFLAPCQGLPEPGGCATRHVSQAALCFSPLRLPLQCRQDASLPWPAGRPWQQPAHNLCAAERQHHLDATM